ncbi:unnamed protein product [Hapterophycus canaliculatus]
MCCVPLGRDPRRSRGVLARAADPGVGVSFVPVPESAGGRVSSRAPRATLPSGRALLVLVGRSKGRQSGARRRLVGEVLDVVGVRRRGRPRSSPCFKRDAARSA